MATLAWTACILWMLSFFAPALRDANGFELVFAAVVFSGKTLSQGSWALLANCTIQWAVYGWSMAIAITMAAGLLVRYLPRAPATPELPHVPEAENDGDR